MTLVLFDIDGTLLHSDGIGKAATERAMLEVFGTQGGLPYFRFGGKTDLQMLHETLENIYNPPQIAKRLDEYDRVLAQYVEYLLPKFNVRPCAGARELVACCLAQKSITTAILTANMPRAAAVKLRAAGYQLAQFAFGVFGSQAPHRNGLPPLAMQQLALLGRSTERVVVIGDTPDDILCARSIEARMISVGTGRYSLDELAIFQPHYLLADLSDTHAVWDLILHG